MKTPLKTQPRTWTRTRCVSLEDVDPFTHSLLKNAFPAGILPERLPALLEVLAQGSLPLTTRARTVSVALSVPYFAVWDAMTGCKAPDPAEGQTLLNHLCHHGFQVAFSAPQHGTPRPGQTLDGKPTPDAP